MRFYIIKTIFISLVFSQNLQVKLVGKIEMRVPMLGPVVMTFEQTVAPGFYKTEEKIEAKRFYARWLLNEKNGEIIIDGFDKIIKYDMNKEKYWFQIPKDYFSPIDSDPNDLKAFSWSFDFEENEPKKGLDIIRKNMNKVETIQGFKARKWNTTILIDGEKTIVFEEWFVDELPLMELSDSLESAIKNKLNQNNDSSQLHKFEFSSNIFIQELDTLSTLDLIPGYPVKINFLVYDEKSPKMAANFEIIELYVTPVDTAYFIIPESYDKADSH
tara:strand:- start:341 stop:1156 length:816 start_codon:yes stop_codon:yes gene_type:complete